MYISKQTLELYVENICLSLPPTLLPLTSSLPPPSLPPVMSAASDITLKLWDSRRGACTSTLRQQQDYIRCLAYSRHREQVASGSLDHSIYLWDLKTLTSLTSTNNKVTSEWYTITWCCPRVMHMYSVYWK